jgi:hypothetical protein
MTTAMQTKAQSAARGETLLPTLRNQPSYEATLTLPPFGASAAGSVSGGGGGHNGHSVVRWVAWVPGCAGAQPGCARPGSATSSALTLVISFLSARSAAGYPGLIARSAVTRTAAVARRLNHL